MKMKCRRWIYTRCILLIFVGKYFKILIQSNKLYHLVFILYDINKNVCSKYFIVYWKEKETHILTFKTSDLLWVRILSRWQQFIPTYTDYKIPQQISLIFADDTFHLRWRHCNVQA